MNLSPMQRVCDGLWVYDIHAAESTPIYKHLASRGTCITMNFSDKTLVKKLAIVLVLKLIVLLALWWFFVRENRVSIDERSAAEQLLSSAPSTEQRKKP